MMPPRATGLCGRPLCSRRACSPFERMNGEQARRLHVKSRLCFRGIDPPPSGKGRSMSFNSRVRNLLCLGVVTSTFAFGMTFNASGADKAPAKKDAADAKSGDQVDFE